MAIKHTFLSKDGHITKKITSLQAIRQKCLECSVWSVYEVNKCSIKDCALYPYRSGKSGIKRNLTDEQRKKLKNRLTEMRQKSK